MKEMVMTDGKDGVAAVLGPVCGVKVPDFHLPAVSVDGMTEVMSTALHGTPYMLYFYPKAATPGCTTQACVVRDILPRLLVDMPQVKGLRVFGVSPDPVKKLAKFIENQALNFTLVSDEEHKVAESYGVWVQKKLYGRSFMGIERSAFLVDSKGILRHMKRKMRPEDQGPWMRDALVQLVG